jgi:hypothetical protein
VTFGIEAEEKCLGLATVAEEGYGGGGTLRWDIVKHDPNEYFHD